MEKTSKKKILKRVLLAFLIAVLLLVGYFFVGKPPRNENVKWGVVFSQMYAEDLGLNWKETYLAILNDLGVKRIKLSAQWDLIEPEEGQYYFNDLDWQMKEAEEKRAKILLVVGIRTPRWPECHIPWWAEGMGKKEQQNEIMKMIKVVVLRYKNSPQLQYWQVENEPFFPFGDCPWSDKRFLKKEIALVKSLDPTHPIIISDSGEGSLWIQAARFGDIVGTTMYKRVYFDFAWARERIPGFPNIGFYVYYPFTPTFYWRKAEIIKKFFRKKVICIEFQAEPWGPVLVYDVPLSEQKRTMDLQKFRYNIEFAKRTGFNEFYLWGTEWWYWMKTKHNNPNIWNEAKKLFSGAE